MTDPVTALPGGSGAEEDDLPEDALLDDDLDGDDQDGDDQDGGALSDTGAAATTYRVAIGADAAGQRLDRVLASALPSLSRSRLKALIGDGAVTEGARVIDDASMRVKPGQCFEVAVPPPVAAAPEPQAIPLSIVYEDDQVIVLDKPAGMVVHPAAGNAEGTLVNALLAHCAGGLSGIGGVARPGIVHRLDKDTSGLMVVAKTDAAHAGLTAQFAGHALARTYVAVVRGVPRPARGTIDAPVGRSPRNRKKMAVVAGGRRAVTHYVVDRILAGGEASVVTCRLETGRTHQIRVHMTHIGHSVAGDPLYGGAPRGQGPAAVAMRRFPRQALHAAGLAFRHPTTGEALSFTAPLPKDVKELIDCLAAAD